jgi:trehalose 6-phosphate synthase
LVRHQQYSEIESEVTGLIGKVNGRFGDAAWTPFRYVNHPISRTVLAGIHRAADVAMTIPLHDGMNLSAKEFLAAQDPDDPGVLILFTICRRCGGTRQGFDRQSA